MYLINRSRNDAEEGVGDEGGLLVNKAEGCEEALGGADQGEQRKRAEHLHLGQHQILQRVAQLPVPWPRTQNFHS